jgi:hypothetical protein
VRLDYRQHDQKNERQRSTQVTQHIDVILMT